MSYVPDSASDENNKYACAAQPANEAERLRMLRWVEILDTEPEIEYDDLTGFARLAFGVSAAQVSLVDAERQNIKSSAGWPRRDAPRSDSFCAHAILRDDPFVILDAGSDDRFRYNPLVQGPPFIRFYAGAPLTIQNGLEVGSFCLLDSLPRRSFSANESILLKHFASLAAREIEKRPEHRYSDATPSAPTRPGSYDRTMILVSDEMVILARSGSDRLFPPDQSTFTSLNGAVANSAGLGDFWEALRTARDSQHVTVRDIWLAGRVTRMQAFPNPVGFAVFLFDITEAWASDSAFRELEQRYSLLLRATSPLLWTYNPSAPTREGLHEWLRYTGQTIEEFRRSPFHALHPEDAVHAQSAFVRAEQKGTSFQFDVRVRRHDGVYRWMHAQGIPRIEADGSISEWVGLHIDVTARYERA